VISSLCLPNFTNADLCIRLNFAGGIPLYEKECREVLNNGFKGFETQSPAVAA